MSNSFKRWSTLWTLIVVLMLPAALKAEDPVSVTSPDGNVKIIFKIGHDDQNGTLLYDVLYHGDVMVQNSRLGLSVKGKANLSRDFKLVDTSRSSVNETWKPVYGQWNHVLNHYNELTVSLKQGDAAGTSLQLMFRAYNEGVAFCYKIPGNGTSGEITITDEHSSFHFTGYHTVYTTNRPQGVYSKTTLNGVHDINERPMTIQTKEGRVMSIAEARMVDYARTELTGGGNNTIVTKIDGPVKVHAPYNTPWRVLFLGDTPSDLLNHQYLMLDLNKPNVLNDVSWIKPGKVIRVANLNTQAALDCIDFAKKHHLDYVHLDDGWYGDKASDPTKARPELDMKKIIKTAHENGIGVIVYIDVRVMDHYDMDPILAKLKSQGIDGVKYGFVHVGSQHWTKWLHDAVKLAAKHDLMVDIHDKYRPTGLSRTYPNLMTQEGIRGDEERQAPQLFLRTLYTRMLAGAADNTFCYYNSRVSKLWSHAFQLAKSVVFYSPLQYLFWYDTPDLYHGEPEIEFWEHMPTTWDDTRALQGEIGKYATVARRSGDEWFIGTITAQPRELKVPLDFLDNDQWYIAHVYVNGGDKKSQTNVRMAQYLVNAQTVMQADLPRAGGQALWLEPATQEQVRQFKSRYKSDARQQDIFNTGY